MQDYIFYKQVSILKYLDQDFLFQILVYKKYKSKKERDWCLFLFRYLLLICIDYSIDFIPKNIYHAITVTAQCTIIARTISVLIRVAVAIFHKKTFPTFKIFLFSNHSHHLLRCWAALSIYTIIIISKFAQNVKKNFSLQFVNLKNSNLPDSPSPHFQAFSELPLLLAL